MCNAPFVRGIKRKTMKKATVLLALAGSMAALPCMAQDGYTISGKVRGIAANKVYIVTADFGRVDTLASAAVNGDTFVLSGIVPGDVRAVNLVFPGIDGQVPLLLENTIYQVQVTANGAAVNGGGPASELFKQFNKISQDYAAEQASVMADFQTAGNSAAAAAALQSRADAAYNTSVQRTLDLIKANPDSYVSAYVVAASSRADGEKLLRQKYEALSETALATVPGQAVEAAITRYNNLAVGQEAPDFTAKRPNGDDLTLSGVPAKIKLLVFWASTDAACRQASPELITLYRQFRPKGFDIIAFSLDENRFAWEKAIEQDGMIWNNCCDFKGTASPIAELYMVGNTLPSGVPTFARPSPTSPRKTAKPRKLITNF